MRDLLLILVGSIYLIIVGIMFIYGANFFHLTIIAWRNGSRKRHQTPTPEIAEWPRVTIQLPVYNERYVVQRLVDQVLQIDYPRELLDIQVLDDSTDDTVAIAAAAVAQAKLKGFDIVHLHRSDRTGFKAGALKEGLTQAKGEFVAMFDADFLPPADFLQRTIPPIVTDPKIAFVQARWGHLNRNYSIITSLQALTIDAHFMVEQFARHRHGYWFNFNGTAGVWRRDAIADAGGWKADTLTEDLDLSYRAYLRGWTGHYVRDLVAPAELPVSVGGFRRQQHRWAQGSLECAVKLIPAVLRSSEKPLIKLHAILHLGGYGVHLFLFAVMLLYPFMLEVSIRFPALTVLFGFAYLMNVTALAPTAFFIVGQQQLGGGWWYKVPRVMFIMMLGAGLMLNTVRAAWHVVSKRDTAFERTAKFGVTNNQHLWQKQRYQLKLDPIVWFELALATYGFVTAYFAFQFKNWAIGIYGSLFSLGLALVAVITIYQALTIYWQQRKLAHSAATPTKPTQDPLT